ncbi:MAG: hypothetical protein AB9915_03715 [Candidatus Dojkabacteria bacterium]
MTTANNIEKFIAASKGSLPRKEKQTETEIEEAREAFLGELHPVVCAREYGVIDSEKAFEKPLNPNSKNSLLLYECALGKLFAPVRFGYNPHVQSMFEFSISEIEALESPSEDPEKDPSPRRSLKITLVAGNLLAEENELLTVTIDEDLSDEPDHFRNAFNAIAQGEEFSIEKLKGC